MTGAARGIGAEFARQLAALDFGLILVDRDKGALLRKACELDAEVVPVTLGLTELGWMDSLRLEVGAREVGLVVSNAAESRIDSFLDHRLDFLLQQIELGCRAPLTLTHEFGVAMSRRQRGGLILMTSLAAFQGTSLAATYAATKAFTPVLGEALWLELAATGVDVVAVAPGATDTLGPRATAPRSTPLGLRSTVVSDALGALGREPLVVPGRANRFTHALLGLVAPSPRRLVRAGDAAHVPLRD